MQTAIMAVRETDKLAIKARPTNTIPRSGGPTLRGVIQRGNEIRPEEAMY